MVGARTQASPTISRYDGVSKGKIGNNHALGIPASSFSDQVLCHFNIHVPVGTGISF